MQWKGKRAETNFMKRLALANRPSSVCKRYTIFQLPTRTVQHFIIPQLQLVVSDWKLCKSCWEIYYDFKSDTGNPSHPKRNADEFSHRTQSSAFFFLHWPLRGTIGAEQTTGHELDRIATRVAECFSFSLQNVELQENMLLVCLSFWQVSVICFPVLQFGDSYVNLFTHGTLQSTEFLAIALVS